MYVIKMKDYNQINCLSYIFSQLVKLFALFFQFIRQLFCDGHQLFLIRYSVDWQIF